MRVKVSFVAKHTIWQKTMSKHYPDMDALSIQRFIIIKNMMDNDPMYLDEDDCPYEYEVVQKIRQLLETIPAAVSFTSELDDLDDIDEIDFEVETKKLFRDIKRFKSTLSSDDSSEQVQTFRTMVTLIEKMIESQERASGIKQFNAFTSMIMDSMDRYLSPTQKTEFLETLELTLDRE
jgi:hypothetical protein